MKKLEPTGAVPLAVPMRLRQEGGEPVAGAMALELWGGLGHIYIISAIFSDLGEPGTAFEALLVVPLD